MAHHSCMKAFSNTVNAAIFAVGLTLLVYGLLQLPFFEAKEHQTGDEMMYLRYQLQNKNASHKPDSHLVLAAIDERSTQELGAWPFPRSIHGQFLQVLAPEKPKVVGWDIFFTETKAAVPSSTPAPAPSPTPAPGSNPSSPAPSANPAPDPIGPLPQAESEDQLLVDGATLIPQMVTASARTFDSQAPITDEDLLPTRAIKNVTGDIHALTSSPDAILPFPALRKVTTFGFADETGDTAGGVRRKVPLVININGRILPSFDLQVLLQYWAADPDKVIVNIGHEITVPRPDGTQASIPIDEHGCLALNYRARLEDFQAMSYVWMAKGLADKQANQQSQYRDHLPPIENNILIIGVVFFGTDAGPTPLDTTAPLVVTHLNALNNILQQDFLRPVSPLIWMPIYALFLFGVGNVGLRVGIAPLIPIGIGSILLLACAGFAALYFGNFLVPVAIPEIGFLLLSVLIPLSRFFGEGREKTRIKNALRACLSEKIMTKVLEHPDNLKLGGTKQQITVMFCDIRGFTPYCDERDPAETMEVLNEYFEAMTQVVFKYDGTIDKYIGDCIMAFWNAPQPQIDHAQRAVCCAMEMRYTLANFKAQRAGIDRELFECGIGIHSGEALVGHMGSSLKRNYTAIGSTVNMAARLESLTKRLNERILISRNVLDQLQGNFPITDRGEAQVPGFSKPIHLYAVVADQDISAALSVGRTLAGQQEYTAEEADKPIWEPAPLPDDADP